MAVQFNPNFRSVNIADLAQKADKAAKPEAGFDKTMGDYVKNVDKEQANSNESIVNLLTGKTQDINAVVADVARADMSFKMLVGVRNKLVTAYQETMKMQV